jgi:hypothetical protein
MSFHVYSQLTFQPAKNPVTNYSRTENIMNFQTSRNGLFSVSASSSPTNRLYLGLSNKQSLIGQRNLNDGCCTNHSYESKTNIHESQLCLELIESEECSTGLSSKLPSVLIPPKLISNMVIRQQNRDLVTNSDVRTPKYPGNSPRMTLHLSRLAEQDRINTELLTFGTAGHSLAQTWGIQETESPMNQHLYHQAARSTKPSAVSWTSPSIFASHLNIQKSEQHRIKFMPNLEHDQLIKSLKGSDVNPNRIQL